MDFEDGVWISWFQLFFVFCFFSYFYLTDFEEISRLVLEGVDFCKFGVRFFLLSEVSKRWRNWSFEAIFLGTMFH